MNNPPLILIVDDEPDFREIFATKLKEVGYNIETAENGEEGFEMAKKTKPDLVLMDMEMPVLNGAGAVLKFKGDSDTKDIKVVFLTNYGDPRIEMRDADVHFSHELGANDYLRKTDDLDRIVEKVKSFLGQ